MLKLTKIEIFVLVLVIALLVFMPDSAMAGTFDGLTNAGRRIFQGLRKIIYPASAIGIICVCMGGFFGNINWKWLTAIIVGLIVISLCAGFIAMFTPDGAKPDLG